MADLSQQNNPPLSETKPMVAIVLSIDLLGTPDDTVYAALHGGMTARRWLTTLTADDGQALPLPGGTYSGQTAEAISDLSQEIHDWILAEIWDEGAIVLVHELGAWSITGNQ